MKNEIIRKQREIIAELEEEKRLTTGQNKLDLTTEIVNEMEKLNRILNPKTLQL